MNRASRALVIAVLVLPLAVGCSDDDDDKAEVSAASVLACRTFFLGGAAGGDSLERDLRAVLAEGSYEPGPLVSQIKSVGLGAGEAGRVPGLAEADYQLYRAVVAATARAEGDVLLTTGSRSLEDATVAALDEALSAVDRHCG